MSEQKLVSRKEFLKKAGFTVAGVAVTGSLASVLTGCAAQPAATVDTSQTPDWPYPYKKLDPDKVAERAFEAYKTKGGWGIGVSDGFFGLLAEEVGYPFNQIRPELWINGAAGYGAATLCGSLGTAAACIGSVCDADMQKKVLADLFNWYKTAEFPSYQPENLGLPTTVADSLLCVDSVGKFMEVSGYAMGDPERKSRCAGVAAECAKKMVELLNEALA